MAENQLNDSESRSKVIYEQNYQEFRSLNTIMWQVPVLVMTFTGGIWFGIASTKLEPLPAFFLYAIVAVGNVLFVNVLWRLRRGVMEPILDAIYRYEGRARAPEKYVVIKAFRVLMYSAAVISLIMAGMNLVEAFSPLSDSSPDDALCL